MRNGNALAELLRRELIFHKSALQTVDDLVTISLRGVHAAESSLWDAVDAWVEQIGSVLAPARDDVPGATQLVLELTL